MSATIILFGNAGNVGELRSTPSGRPVLTFGLAHKRGRDEVTWYNVTVWGKRAEWAAEYLKKGEKCHVVGQLELRSYTAKDGEQRISPDVEASSVDIAWIKYGEGGGARPAPASPAQRPQTFEDADIPF